MAVIKIINDKQIVVRGGKNIGIKINDILEVYVPGESVKDPITGEDLGTLDFVKAKLRADIVYDKMTMCVSAEYNNSVPSLSNILPIDRLDVNYEEVSGGYFSQNIKSSICIGDLVRLA